MSFGFGFGLPLWYRNQAGFNYVTLLTAAESAAKAGGISIWYAPPDSFAPRSTNGPFVASDGTGPAATLNDPVGFVKDRKVA